MSLPCVRRKVNSFLNIPLVDDHGCTLVPMSRPESLENLSTSNRDCDNGSGIRVSADVCGITVLPVKRSPSTSPRAWEGPRGRGIPLHPAPVPGPGPVPDPLVYYKAHISTNFFLRFYQYKRDLKVKFTKVRPLRVGGGRRKDIKEFSDSSRRNLIFLIRNTEDIWKGKIELTYPGTFSPRNGTVSKAHLSALLEVLKRRGITSYISRLEFQERGVPHYHLLINGFIHYDDLAEAWDRIIGNDWRARGEAHSATTTVKAIRCKAQLYYQVQRYLAKKDQQSKVPEGFPHVGRFWSSSRNLLVPKKVIDQVGAYYLLCGITRLVRKWYSARLRLLQGRPFRWSGYSFTAYDGSRFINSMRL